jgi:hypothetical protein
MVHHRRNAHTQNPEPNLIPVISCHINVILRKLYHTKPVGGFNPSEKYYSIGMIIPNIWEKKMFQTTNQKNIKWPKLAHFSGLGQPVRSKNGQSEIPLCKSWLVTVRTCCHLWQKMANHQIYQLL